MFDKLLQLVPPTARWIVLALAITAGLGWSAAIFVGRVNAAEAAAMRADARVTEQQHLVQDAHDTAQRIDSRLSVLEKALSDADEDRTDLKHDVHELRSILLEDRRREHR